MTTDDLKQLISEMPMDDELKDLTYELIGDTTQVNEDILELVAGILEMQAEFYEKASSVLLDEADEYQALDMTLKDLDNKEIEQKLEMVIEEQENLISKLDQHMAEFKKSNPEQKQENVEIAKAQDELSQIASSAEMPTPTHQSQVAENSPSASGPSTPTQSTSDGSIPSITASTDTNSQNWQ